MARHVIGRGTIARDNIALAVFLPSLPFCLVSLKSRFIPIVDRQHLSRIERTNPVQRSAAREREIEQNEHHKARNLRYRYHSSFMISSKYRPRRAREARHDGRGRIPRVFFSRIPTLGGTIRTRHERYVEEEEEEEQKGKQKQEQEEEDRIPTNRALLLARTRDLRGRDRLSVNRRIT